MSAEGASPSSHSSFCEEVFSRSEPDWRIPESVYSETANPNRSNLNPASLANEVERSNILAPGFRSRLRGITFFPPSPPKFFGDWPWEVVSSYSSATAPGFHGISRADPLS
jgi:hypothetical protein